MSSGLLEKVSVVASLPIFAGRGLIVFAEGIVPGLADYGPQEIDALFLTACATPSEPPINSPLWRISW